MSTVALGRPAQITEGEWQDHRGKVIRLDSAVSKLTSAVTHLDGNVDLLRGDMQGLRLDLQRGDDRVRESSSSDLRAQLAEYQAKTRDSEIKELRRQALEARKWWWELGKAIVAAVAGAALMKFLHL